MIRTRNSESIEKTIQTTNSWLNELRDELKMTDNQKVFSILIAVLHSIRDRLPKNEAIDFSAQLTPLIRGFYFEGWCPNKTPIKIRRQEEFISKIKEEYGYNDIDEIKVAIIISYISFKLANGEVDHIKSVMPNKLKEYWEI